MNLWWERGQPAPTEPPDGAVVRIIGADGAVLLAERNDWSLHNHATDQDTNPPTDGHVRRWFLHNHEALCGDKQPRTWDELVDQAQQLIIFVAVAPEQLAELTSTHTDDTGELGDSDA